MFTKLFTISLIAVSTIALNTHAGLFITGVFDGPLSGGTPKGIELYATQDISDLSTYAVGSANNGGGTDGAEFALSGSVSTGDYIYVVANGNDDEFLTFFGPSTPATFTSSSMSINGDDAIELFSGGSVVDTFGDIDVDGNGEDWEYLDGWAYRGTITEGGTFALSDWTFSGPNAWDGAADNASSDAVMPIGTFTVSPIPEPSAYALLVGLLGLSYILTSRRRA